MDVHPTRNGVFICIDPYPSRLLKEHIGIPRPQLLLRRIAEVHRGVHLAAQITSWVRYSWGNQRDISGIWKITMSHREIIMSITIF